MPMQKAEITTFCLRLATHFKVYARFIFYQFDHYFFSSIDLVSAFLRKA